MSKVQTLRAFVKQRLSLAAEEIFELFERTIAEYEEQLCRQNKLLDAVFKPQLQLHRADVQLLLPSKTEDPPELQEESSGLDQEDPAELPHVKEEQEELWISQEGEQLQGPEEAEINKSTFIPVPIKREVDGEEKLLQRQTKLMKTEAGGEDCGGPEPEPEPARKLNPERHLQPDTDDKRLDRSEPETEASWVWEDTRDLQTGFNPLGNSIVPVSDIGCKTGKTSVSSSDWARIHSERKRFSCAFCKRSFQWRRDCERHMRVHTGERPHSCSICGKKFARKVTLTRHLTVHTVKFVCIVCGETFTRRANVKKHKCDGETSGSQTQQDRSTEGKTCLNTDEFRTEIQTPN